MNTPPVKLKVAFVVETEFMLIHIYTTAALCCRQHSVGGSLLMGLAGYFQSTLPVCCLPFTAYATPSISPDNPLRSRELCVFGEAGLTPGIQTQPYWRTTARRPDGFAICCIQMKRKNSSLYYDYQRQPPSLPPTLPPPAHF